MSYLLSNPDKTPMEIYPTTRITIKVSIPTHYHVITNCKVDNLI